MYFFNSFFKYVSGVFAMKKFVQIAALSLLAMSASAYANDNAHEDAATMAAQTVKTQTVKYACQSGKKVTVKYGFNKQNLPTYAEAHLNGKTRFMPVNLNLSDAAGTHFGDDNNFSLAGDAFDYKTVRKSYVNIQDPASNILFKGCKAGKGKK